MGNQKLEDGNLCKDCAKQLSPWFSDRRRSTVEDIKRQLAYREENRGRASQFRTTRSYGEDCKVLLDEEHRWFTVTRARDLADANPDILDCTALTGCRVYIEPQNTVQRPMMGQQGMMGQRPMAGRPQSGMAGQRPMMNQSGMNQRPMAGRPQSGMTQRPMMGQMNSVGRMNTMAAGFDPESNREYRKYREMGDEIRAALLQVMETARGGGAVQTAPMQQEAPMQQQETFAPAPAAAGPWTCPACGGQNDGKFCEYCGAPRG